VTINGDAQVEHWIKCILLQIIISNV